MDAELEEVADNAGKYWKTGLAVLDSCGVVEAEAALPDSHDAKPLEHLREYHAFAAPDFVVEAWAAAPAHHPAYFALTRSISSRPLAHNHPHCSSLHRSSARLRMMKAVSSPTQ